MKKNQNTKTDKSGFTRQEKELYKKLGKDNVVIEIKAKVNGKMKIITGIQFKYDTTWQIGRWPIEKDLKNVKENSRIYKNVKKYFKTAKA